MRYCKSKSDEQRAACGCKKKQAKANTGPTPSRAATFAKKRRRIMRREYSKGTMLKK